MTIEKKTIRSDIPGHHTMMMNSISYAGTTQEESRRLVIGREITLNGNIAACEHLVIEGTVEAQSFTARRLDILEAGIFTGNAELQDGVIAGKFDGKLKVTGRLTVKSTGRITGEIDYGTLEVEAGARIEGTMRPSAIAVDAASLVEVKRTNDNLDAILDTASTETAESTDDRAKVFRRSVGY